MPKCRICPFWFWMACSYSVQMLFYLLLLFFRYVMAGFSLPQTHENWIIFRLLSVVVFFLYEYKFIWYTLTWYGLTLCVCVCARANVHVYVYETIIYYWCSWRVCAASGRVPVWLYIKWQKRDSQDQMTLMKHWKLCGPWAKRCWLTLGPVLITALLIKYSREISAQVYGWNCVFCGDLQQPTRFRQHLWGIGSWVAHWMKWLPCFNLHS